MSKEKKFFKRERLIQASLREACSLLHRPSWKPLGSTDFGKDDST